MICVDASVAAKWILPEEWSDRAETLLAAAIRHDDPVLAPDLMPMEVANVLRRGVRQGLLTLADAERHLDTLLALPLVFVPVSPLHHAALVVADRYDLPAVYDAYYVALAQIVGATLWTADERLLRLLGGTLEFVRSIATY